MTNQTENKLIYLPIYLSDYVSQSRKLTMLQRGAFIDLAVLYFQENLQLNYQKQQIYRMVFAFEKEEQEAIDFILDNFFIKTENKPIGYFWVSNELNQLGDKVLKRLNASRENGKLGGRGNKKQNKPVGSNLVNLDSNLDKSILNESKLNESKLKEKKLNNIYKDLPIFINKDLFNSFVEMRIKIKKPMTTKAKELLIRDLTRFENLKQGNANISLENSIKNSWQGVFEPRVNNFSNQQKTTGMPKPNYDDPNYYLDRGDWDND
jgi:uncharacterized protein YdaU (DUF1376 family)